MCQREDKYVYLVNERYWRGYIYIEETGLVFELGLYFFLCKYLKQRNGIGREHNKGCYEIIRGGSNYGKISRRNNKFDWNTGVIYRGIYIGIIIIC